MAENSNLLDFLQAKKEPLVVTYCSFFLSEFLELCFTVAIVMVIKLQSGLFLTSI
jgi:hypothetical protein